MLTLSEIKTRATKFLALENACILDLETILKPDKIIEISILSRRGVLLDTLVNPAIRPRRGYLGPIWSHGERLDYTDIRTTVISGIPFTDLLKAPLLVDLYPQLEKIFAEFPVVAAWNGNCFDKPVFNASLEKAGLAPLSPTWVDPIDWYRDFLKRKGQYEARKKPAALNGPHRALGDCYEVVKKLREMKQG